jgi:hypothetical protein
LHFILPTLKKDTASGATNGDGFLNGAWELAADYAPAPIHQIIRELVQVSRL